MVQERDTGRSEKNADHRRIPQTTADHGRTGWQAVKQQILVFMSNKFRGKLIVA